MKRFYTLAFIMALSFAVAIVPACREDYERSLEIRISLIPHAGNGVFAKEFIPAGAYLGHYGGKYITHAEHHELMKQNKWHYVMGLLDCAATTTGGYTRIDGVNGNVFTRINYAPKEFQNVKFKKICERPYVLILAIKDIQPGEELYIDYGPNYRYDFMTDRDVLDFFEKLRIKGNAIDSTKNESSKATSP